MLHCPKCQEYTLQAACPRCGGRTSSRAPAKYSPEDTYGTYRRKLKRLDGKTVPSAPPAPKP